MRISSEYQRERCQKALDKHKPPKVKEHVWATYIPDRTPAFKISNQFHHAKIACGREGFILYHLSNGTWNEIVRSNYATNGKTNCENCTKEMESIPYMNVNPLDELDISLHYLCNDCKKLIIK